MSSTVSSSSTDPMYTFKLNENRYFSVEDPLSRSSQYMRKWGIGVSTGTKANQSSKGHILPEGTTQLLSFRYTATDVSGTGSSAAVALKHSHVKIGDILTSLFTSPVVHKSLRLSDGKGGLLGFSDVMNKVLARDLPSNPSASADDTEGKQDAMPTAPALYCKVNYDILNVTEKSLKFFDELVKCKGIMRETIISNRFPLLSNNKISGPDCDMDSTYIPNNNAQFFVDEEDAVGEGNLLGCNGASGSVARKSVNEMSGGRIQQMMDVHLEGGVIISNKLREFFMLPDDSYSDNEYKDEIFSGDNKRKRSEFLYHVMWRLVAGGALCQWDDEFGLYKKVARDLYKDCVCVARRINTSNMNAIDDEESAKNAKSKGDMKQVHPTIMVDGVNIPSSIVDHIVIQSEVALVKSAELFSASQEMKPAKIPLFPNVPSTGENVPANDSYMYVIVNYTRREVVVWYHGSSCAF